MPKVDEAWVREQFEIAKVRVGVGKAVLELLKAWSELDLNEKQAAEVMEIFSRVGLDIALVEVPKDELWVPLQPGFIQVADEVRVMNNAFTGDLGRLHNGRRGKVVAVRHGDVIFNSTDGKEPKLESVHYSPYKLEKRVK